MVSSTYSDLRSHREVLIEALNQHELHPRVMEHSAAQWADVLASSLKMVRESAAYVAIIGRRYGQIPDDPERNPRNLSITELEFKEAQRLGRPTWVFFMSEEHLIRERDIEGDPEKKVKLANFRERAKKWASGSGLERVYATFDSVKSFATVISRPVSDLREHLILAPPPEPPAETPEPDAEAQEETSRTRTPPDLYAEPSYLGSHAFVGRQAELDTLTDWADPADPTPLLLFEAIGGSGKSLLTWEWATNLAPDLRSGDQAWAGRFWYSFYERGAVMADFCRHALAYITSQPVEDFRKMKTPELGGQLLAYLQKRSWLLVLDGLERVLVAYHRLDAAQLPDEAAGDPTDAILGTRVPTSTIRDEDGDLLRYLSTASPSKILVTTRLTPRSLLNPAGLPIPGVRRESLAGLRPADAETLFRAAGDITGDSTAIRAYLRENCNNHPLVIGVLAGLVANYFPDRGNFDAWVSDAGPEGGARLDLGKLDLVQRRNHILRAAMADLPEASRQLLSTLALISSAVDTETLAAFNPHLPPEPETVPVPTPPEERWPYTWDHQKDDWKAEKQREYEAALAERAAYEKAFASWKASEEVATAPTRLGKTVQDLEARGLVQYDAQEKRYDLHPVVRGVASGSLEGEEKAAVGQQVVDHFSSVVHNPYDEAETLEDVASGVQVVRTLLALGRMQEAVDVFQGELANAFIFNLEANVEALALLRPLFPEGWGEPEGLDNRHASYIASCAATALYGRGQFDAALASFGTSLRLHLRAKDWFETAGGLRSHATCLREQNRVAASDRIYSLALNLAEVWDDKQGVFMGRLFLFQSQARVGDWESAWGTWEALNPMGRAWNRAAYRPGSAERLLAQAQLWEGTLGEKQLVEAIRLASKGRSRTNLRYLHGIRGDWRVEQKDWPSAASAFREAMRMANERGLRDATSATGLVLAKWHSGEMTEEAARAETERLSAESEAHYYLALLWQALSEPDRAKKHALSAYKWACCIQVGMGRRRTVCPPLRSRTGERATGRTGRRDTGPATVRPGERSAVRVGGRRAGRH
ncbi:MAG: DUF4062 domain-containing protein [Bacteroidota bacterium]